MSLIVGLTGGIASGKSTVSNILKEMGVTVIDADVEARLSVSKGEPAYFQIINEFGEDILMPNGEINREKLGSIVFHQEKKRLLLNKIVHPDVRKRINKKKDAAIKRGEEFIVLDIPLLFESNLTYMVDRVILVYVDQEIQIERLMNRNHLSKEEAEARIHSQMPLNEKKNLADVMINNNGSLIETKQQLNQILLAWGIKF